MTVTLFQASCSYQPQTAAPITTEVDVPKITQGADAPKNIYQPNQPVTLKVSSENAGFKTAAEYQKSLREKLKPTTEISVTEKMEDGEKEYTVTLEDCARTIEEYDGGILLKNGAEDIEDGIEGEVEGEVDCSCSHDDHASGQPMSNKASQEPKAKLPPYMQAWQDLHDEAEAELKTNPDSAYAKGMLAHTKATLAAMKSLIPAGTGGGTSETTDSYTSEITDIPSTQVSDDMWSQQPNGKLSEAEADSIAMEVIKRLKEDLGLTTEQAAGIVGNLYYESDGMNPHVNEFAYAGPNPYGNPNNTQFGYGWAQWSYDRRPLFINFAKTNKLAVGSPEHNYQFLVHELKSTEAGSLKSLKQQSFATAAAQSFRVKFERAEFPNDGPRLEAATRLANLYNNL